MKIVKPHPTESGTHEGPVGGGLTGPIGGNVVSLKSDSGPIGGGLQSRESLKKIAHLLKELSDQFDDLAGVSIGGVQSEKKDPAASKK
jgi:hypothetical protein